MCKTGTDQSEFKANWAWTREENRTQAPEIGLGKDQLRAIFCEAQSKGRRLVLLLG
jgi:hypothetical protein